MRIVIVGAGAVGFNLAAELSREGYDVAVIEKNPKLIKRLKDTLDVQPVRGSGCLRLQSRYRLSLQRQSRHRLGFRLCQNLYL